MRKQVYWGITTLSVLINIVCVFLLIDKYGNPDNEIIYNKSHDKFSQKTGDVNVQALDTSSLGKSSRETDLLNTDGSQSDNLSTPMGKGKEEYVAATFLLPPSSVPKDIPEHLKLPPEWIDGRYHGLQDEMPNHYKYTEEDSQRFLNILKEIVRDHNPHRPLADIWDRYIEYEKLYRGCAVGELGYLPSVGFAYNRIDWQYEQTWAFPEIINKTILNPERPPLGEEFRLVTTKRIEMGELEPDWNYIKLKDGRDFFIRGETRYEFVYQYPNGKNSIGFSRTAEKNSPIITIDVFSTSNKKLQELGGWDYSINPITLRPIQYETDNLFLYMLQFPNRNMDKAKCNYQIILIQN